MEDAAPGGRASSEQAATDYEAPTGVSGPGSALTAPLPPPKPTSSGAPGIESGAAPRATPRQHEVVQRSLGFVVCRACGHYSQSKLRAMAKGCPGPLPYRDERSDAEKKRALYRSRLLNHLHPLTGEALP